jgi:chromosome partitioning protein
MRPYIVAIFNQKGGISKTTTSTNLAVCLAAFGKSVVVIDLDSQGDSTKSLGIDPKTKQGIYDLFTNGAAVEDVMVETMFEGSGVPSTTAAGIEISCRNAEFSGRSQHPVPHGAGLRLRGDRLPAGPHLPSTPGLGPCVIIPVTATPMPMTACCAPCPLSSTCRRG